MTRATMAAALTARLMASNESVQSADGMEREYVFYGQLVDKEELEKAASFCDQEQYRIMVPAKEANREIAVRIRKTVSWYRKDSGGLFTHDPVYHLTIKSYVKGEKGCTESENELPTEAGRAMFEIFRTNGSDGLIKRRYVFPIEGNADGMAWEVDVPKEFRDSKSLTRSEIDDGSDCWVKLDLEVHNFDLELTKDSFSVPFPIQLKNVIYAQHGERSKDEEAKVKIALGQLSVTP